MTRVCWLSLLLMMACARGDGEGTTRPGGDRAAAQRIYVVAEERYAAGAFDEAVALMRQALLQLPASPENDELRHELVLRMGHTQLRDHAATGRVASLHDAQQMLTRYLERHEKLFGDGKEARAERGEVYELLFLVEQQLEPASQDDGATDDETIVIALDDASTPPTGLEALVVAVGSVLAGMGEPEAEPTAAPASERDSQPPATPIAAAETDASAEPEDTKASARHTDTDGNEVREIVVRGRGRLATLDDPRVMERLRSKFSIPWGDLVLTKPGMELIHGPRPLVRGTSRLAGDGSRRQHQLARRAGQSLLRSARQPLRDCYDAAYARQPLAALTSKIEASIHPNGSVSHVRIVDGGLVDGHGDACLIEALQATNVQPLAEAEVPVRVQVALVFFYESAKYMVEGTGEVVSPGGPVLRPNPKTVDGLPPIEKLVKLPGG